MSSLHEEHNESLSEHPRNSAEGVEKYDSPHFANAELRYSASIIVTHESKLNTVHTCSRHTV